MYVNVRLFYKKYQGFIVFIGRFRLLNIMTILFLLRFSFIIKGVWRKPLSKCYVITIVEH